MKTLLLRVTFVVLAVFLSAYAQMNKTTPFCQNGMALFYFTSSSTLPLRFQIFNPLNYSRYPPTGRTGECEGTETLCAICAVIDNPDAAYTDQLPTFNEYQGNATQQFHTLMLTYFLDSYLETNDCQVNDGTPGFLYEYDTQP